MMLRTLACEPARWVAMLPQKFSAATTFMVPEPADVEVSQAVASIATAPRTARATHLGLDTGCSIPVAHVTCASLLRYHHAYAETEARTRPGSRPRAEPLAGRL